MGKKIIVVIDHYVPTFDKDAGSKTTFQYLKMFLKKGYVVKFIGDNYLHEEPYTSTLQQMGIEVLYGQEYLTGIWDWLVKNGKDIHVAYLNRPHIATKYVDFIKEHTDIKMIYYGHDLHFMREFREYELTGDVKKRQESEYWKSIEFSLFHKVAVSYYPSYVEEEAIHAVDETIPVKAITAYVYEEFLQNLNKDFAKREGLLFGRRLCASAERRRGALVRERSIPEDPGTDQGQLLHCRIQSNRRDQSTGTAWKRHHRQRFCK